MKKELLLIVKSLLFTCWLIMLIAVILVLLSLGFGFSTRFGWWSIIIIPFMLLFIGLFMRYWITLFTFFDNKFDEIEE